MSTTTSNPQQASKSSYIAASNIVPRSEQDPALLDAWRLYLAYDKAAMRQKDWHSGLRKWVILLGVAASIFAVVIAQPPFSANASLQGILRVILIILPIAIASVMTFASEFTPSSMWVVYRFSAQKVLREIYLYRMQAGHYAEVDREPIAYWQQKLLLDRVDKARETTNKLESIDPFLLKFQTDQGIVKAVKSWYDSKEFDKGFTALSGEQYVQDRAIPQRDWYIDKLNQDYKRLRLNRRFVLAVAAVGSVAAGISADLAWLVVVTTAIIGAITTWMELRMQGRTYGNYHLTAEKMDRKISEWRIVPADRQADAKHVANMVLECEMIFRAEEITWMRQALQSQMAAEQSLIKNLNEWTNQQIMEEEYINVDKWLTVQPADEFLEADPMNVPEEQAQHAADASTDSTENAQQPDQTAWPPSANGNNGNGAGASHGQPAADNQTPQDNTAG